MSVTANRKGALPPFLIARLREFLFIFDAGFSRSSVPKSVCETCKLISRPMKGPNGLSDYGESGVVGKFFGVG